MKAYELSEFTSLLRLGLWSGGEIAGLGYVSVAREANGDPGLSGLTGVWFGNGIMLENIQPDNVEMKLVFSLYDPYEGVYKYYNVYTYSAGSVEEVLQALTEKRGGAQAYIGGSLREKRKYESTYTSIRSGTIPKPRTR